MTLEEFLNRFPQKVRTGKGVLVPCPGHRDTNPSLDVCEKEGRILLHCYAGCSTEAILRAMGLKMSDLFTEAKPKQERREREPEAIYQYTDEGGAVLFEVVRLPGKQFRQCRPDGKGGWIWNLNGVRRALYRLPEVISAKSVIICEGERDVETVRKLGLVATCNPHGAGKWRPEYSEFLRGKRVAVICDADAPGLAHGRDVARSLVSVAASLKLIEALPGKGVKDLADYIHTGGDAGILAGPHPRSAGTHGGGHGKVATGELERIHPDAVRRATGKTGHSG